MWQWKAGVVVVVSWVSLRKTAHNWLFIAPPSPSHQTPRHYNHLILHHYRLSNFIKPHTWFWLCCSATAFQPCHFSEFYCAGIEVNRARAQLAVSALCCFSMCSQPAIFPRREVTGQKSRFPGDLLNLATLTWSWRWLWVWFYETLFTSSEVINTPWEPVFSCGFPLPSAISLQKSEAWFCGRGGESKGCVYLG